MNGKYLTVLEFAEKADISKQTIYEQMKPGKRLAPYVRKINGRKCIRVDALAFYTSDAADPEPEPEAETVKGGGDAVIEILMEQIRVKDRQIEMQAEQLRDMTEALKASQVMQHALQSQIARLTGETATDGTDDASEPETATDGTDNAPEPETATETPPETAQAPVETDTQQRGGLREWFRRIFS